MNSKYKLVVFDVDGTLLNTEEGVLSSAKYAITKMGFEIPSEKILKSFIGPPIQDSFERVFHIHGAERALMSSLFRNHYKDVDLFKAKPYSGIYEMLNLLRQSGYQIAIATYKREDYALRITEHFGFDRYTDIICGSDFGGKLTKADIIQLAIRKSGVDNSEAIMVGDTMQDAAGAQKEQIKFIAVTYGFGFKPGDVLAEGFCLGMAHGTQDIYDIIRKGK